MNKPYNPDVFVPSAPVDPVVQERTQKINDLELGLPLLSERDGKFARDLVYSFRQYGALSDKQGYWVMTLLDRIHEAKNPLPPAAPIAPMIPANQVQLDPGFTKVVALFEAARSKGLKAPRIRLQTEQGLKVVLRMCGPQSKWAGQITVTDNGTSFENRQYFGRITQAGEFLYAHSIREDVLKLVQDLAQNPQGMAALYGFKTSTCCFCGLGLTTSESVTMGYGPICAERYGLSWGEQVETTYTKLTCEEVAS